MSTQIRGYCTLCRSRCGTLNTVSGDALLRVQPDTDHPTGQAICPKGRSAPELVHSPHRVLHPLRRTAPKGSADPGWQRISWDEALSEIASRFSQIRAENGPEAVAFGVTTPSGTPLSDSIDWIERFVRGFGSPNIAYGTEVCNWHKDHAHAFTYGCGIPVADYSNANLIMLWGHNPSSSWLAQANAIAEGRRAGARLLVIDPRRTALAAQADVWLQVKPGTDAALALGIANLVLDSKRYNDDFVRHWTNAPLLVRSDTGKLLRAHDVSKQRSGSDTWMVWDTYGGAAKPYNTQKAAQVCDAHRFALRGEYAVMIDGQPVLCHPVFELLARRCNAYSPQYVEVVTGVPQASLQAAAELIVQSPAVAYHAWSGVAQSTNATQTERAIAVLYALTGSFDIPGGNRVYPAQPINSINGLDLISEAQRFKALGLRERPLGPAAMGWITARDLYQAILTGSPYPIRGFMGFGTNQLASQGDVDMGQKAFSSLEFHVHCDLFETPSARYADIFLPVNTPWEREGLRVGFEISVAAQDRVQLRPQMVRSRGESRSDNDIVFDLACRLGMGAMFFDGSLEQGWNYQLAPLGINVATLRQQQDGTLLMPRKHRDRKYSLTQETADGRAARPDMVMGFSTQTRRVELYSEVLFRHGYDPLPHHNAMIPLGDSDRDGHYPYTLTSAKSGYYCHSQHRSVVSLRKRARLPEATMSAALATEKKIEAGDWVRVSTPVGSARFVAVLDERISKDVICAEYGWWQACPEIGEPAYAIDGRQTSNYNSLISASQSDPVSGSVPMRQFPCTIERDECVDPEKRAWPGLHPFTVRRMRRVAEGVLELVVAPEDGRSLPDYRPGQHIMIEVTDGSGQTITRTYSLLGPARQRHRDGYRIAVRHQRGALEDGSAWEGLMSGHLHSRIRTGSTIMVGAPNGTFILPEYSPQPVVLFAGGIGITPFLSYLESLLDVPAMPEVWLYYANRNSQSKAYADRLVRLAERLPRLRLVDYYSEPLLADNVTAEIPEAQNIPEVLIQARARFYMCGPPPMMDSLRAGLEMRGVPEFDIFSEVFRSPPVVDPDSSGSFKVQFARTDTLTKEWTAQCGTLLNFGEKLGIDMPSGCRVGQCESCAVKLIDGQVHHLHGVEPDDPSICLTCQAIPLTDVVLDV